MPNKCLSDPGLIDFTDIREVQVEARDAGEQLVLGTEVADYHRRIDRSPGRYIPDRGPLIPVLCEKLLGR